MILLRGLKAMTALHPKGMPLRVLEIGAGDGSLMLGVAQALASAWSDVELTLLDRQPLLDAATVASYREVGWTVTQKVGDVIDWAADTVNQLEEPVLTRWDLIVANLFLHHFESAQLALILRAIAKRSRRFFACEPRRDWLALAGSHMVSVIGANHVTREDSVLSVHAGFNGDELTDLWPEQDGPWQVQEYSAGLFSHCFRAERAGLDR
jgi:2-polyprenyl-3-methyl-5-hydroxy-6-metoxy-1,4-benzoquinol methylase